MRTEDAECRLLLLQQQSIATDKRMLQLQQQAVAAENAQAAAERALSALKCDFAAALDLSQQKEAALEGRLKASLTSLSAAQAFSTTALASMKEKELDFLSKQLKNAARFSSAAKEVEDAKLKVAELEQEMGVLKDALAQSQAVATAARASCEEMSISLHNEVDDRMHHAHTSSQSKAVEAAASDFFLATP